ncbi:hypothetical protein [Glycocaulis sp.]
MSKDKSIIIFPEAPASLEKSIYIEFSGNRIRPSGNGRPASNKLDDADTFLSRSKANSLLAIYFRPEFELARQIRNEQLQDSTIEALTARFERLVKLARKYPRNVVLLDFEKARANRDLVERILSERSWGNLHGLYGSETDYAVDDVSRALARLAIIELPVLRRIGSELEAREASVFPDLHNQPLSLRAIGELSALHDENKSLSSELFRTQGELQEEIRKYKALEKSLRDTRKKLDKDLRIKERKIIRMKQELRQETSQSAALQSELDALQVEAASLQKSLDQVFSSTSWQVSAPLRWVRSAAGIVFGRRSPPAGP